MSAPIEIVLFDVGGVLVEVAGIEILRQWTDPAASDADIWTLWLESEAARAFERGESDSRTFACDLVTELGLPVGPDDLLAGLPGWIAGLLPGASQLLDDIPDGLRLGTLSNSNPVHWPRITDALGLGPRFDIHFVSYQTGHVKPDPEAFAYAVDALGCRPEVIFFIDDNQVNVDAARRIGIRAHRTRGPAEAREVLAAHGLVGRSRSHV